MQNKKTTRSIFKVLKGTAVSLGALLFFLHPAPAKAQGLSPTSSWDVVPIQSSSTQTPTCMVSATYKNQDRLIFARDVSGALSGALIRGDSTQAKKQNIKLNVDIDGDYQRHFVAEWGVNDKLVFSIGHDYDFYDGLMAGYKMNIRLGEKGSALSYSLKGSADGLRGVNACLKRLSGQDRLAFEKHDPYEIEPAAFERAIVTPQNFINPARNYIKVHYPETKKRTVSKVEEPDTQDTVIDVIPEDILEREDVKEGTLDKKPAPLAETKPKTYPHRHKICNLDDAGKPEFSLLRRQIKAGMQPQLNLLGEGDVNISYNLQDVIKPVTWERDDIKGYFSVIPYKDHKTTTHSIKQTVLNDLKKACTGDFAKTKSRENVQNGVVFDEHIIVCAEQGTPVMANISFLSDGLETAILSLEGGQEHFRALEQQRDLILTP